MSLSEKSSHFEIHKLVHRAESSCKSGKSSCKVRVLVILIVKDMHKVSFVSCRLILFTLMLRALQNLSGV